MILQKSYSVLSKNKSSAYDLKCIEWAFETCEKLGKARKSFERAFKKAKKAPITAFKSSSKSELLEAFRYFEALKLFLQILITISTN